jgi:hypothetical protein
MPITDLLFGEIIAVSSKHYSRLINKWWYPKYSEMTL